MNLRDCYIEEDLFPKIFAKFEERDYGILLYNTENKDSFDSNHAVIYRKRIQNLQAVLFDIAEFYKAKGSRPIIYQSMLDDNWFDEIKDVLAASGYKSWTENQEFMFFKEKNAIDPNPEIEVRKVEKMERWGGVSASVEKSRGDGAEWSTGAIGRGTEAEWRRAL